MALLSILKFPNPNLRKVAEPVSDVNDEIKQLVDDMFETMYEGNGIGLAATQVDVQKRIITIDVSDQRNEPICLINPEIIKKEGFEKMAEGCLSIPGVYEKVERAERIEVKALDRHGNNYDFEADGLFAVCIQHEIDHLDGKLFIDYLSPLKRKMLMKKMEKNRRRTL